MAWPAPNKVRYPVRVITHPNASVVRRLGRAAALTPAALVLLAAAPAMAAPPQSWPEPEPISGLYALLLLAGAPLALIGIITLLVYVPSMARGEKYTPGLAWRNESEWFGGPAGGVEAVDRRDAPELEGSDPEHAKGGASGRW